MTAVQPLWSIPSARRGPTGYGSSIDRYQIFNCISNGSYGAVYRAWDKEKEELVAMKHEFGGFSQSTLREVSVLKSLRRHPSIVEFKEVVVDEEEDRVFVVMEYLPTDLKRFTDAKEKPCTMRELRRTMRQILEGVEFLHRNGVMHRDLKPSNIVMDRDGRRLKICDLGSSRRSRKGEYTPGNEVVTLWYRAPELLLGANRYTSAVDMWSVGCIMAELAVKKVLFEGRSEIDQLARVQGIMEDPLNMKLRMRLTVAASEAGVPWFGARGFDLLEQLLEMDPKRRITARDALRHGWFREQ
ncbi:hypothetical protein C2S51_035679 [Perilla frutescens var. frutescens]|nr:hypothetical protein C2S51_035679 [Perilla frutescens var. frutescens]